MPARKVSCVTTKATADRRVTRVVPLSLIEDAEHCVRVIQQGVLRARVSVWIGTANVKELMIEAPIGTVARARGRYLSILQSFDDLAVRGVELRILHATVPSRAFRAELARHPTLARGALELRQCPRVHLKAIVVDGTMLYLGSANFTGAGLGAKGEGRRNFELGMMTEDDVLIDVVQGRFERIWTGQECGRCRLRAVCPKPLNLL